MLASLLGRPHSGAVYYVHDEDHRKGLEIDRGAKGLDEPTTEPICVGEAVEVTVREISRLLRSFDWNRRSLLHDRGPYVVWVRKNYTEGCPHIMLKLRMPFVLVTNEVLFEVKAELSRLVTYLAAHCDRKIVLSAQLD